MEGKDGKTTATRESEALRRWWTPEKKARLHELALSMDYGTAMKVLWDEPESKEEAKRLFGAIQPDKIEVEIEVPAPVDLAEALEESVQQQRSRRGRRAS
jgi:hypothetical protein